MRAVVIRAFGGPEVLEMADVPVPAVGARQVRIRVEAATVNPVDLATRSGALAAAGMLPERDQIGIGWDVAGVVEETGPEVTGIVPGQRVVGLSDRLDVPLGTQADQVVLDADAVARAPEGVSPERAATLPLNGLTAVQALDRLGELEINEVLVEAGPTLAGEFLRRDLADELLVYVAPVLLGVEARPLADLPQPASLAQARRFSLCETRTVGTDVCMRLRRAASAAGEADSAAAPGN